MMDFTYDGGRRVKGAYHCGLVHCGISGGGRKTTCILEMRRSVDFLSCELWKYLGQHCTTKAAVREKKVHFLDWINRTYGTEFTRLIVD